MATCFVVCTVIPITVLLFSHYIGRIAETLFRNRFQSAIQQSERIFQSAQQP
jgi:hypothetical protein